MHMISRQGLLFTNALQTGRVLVQICGRFADGVQMGVRTGLLDLLVLSRPGPGPGEGRL